MHRQNLCAKFELITGAAGGMGIGITRQYAKAGAKVYVADLNEKKLSEMIDKLAEEGLNVIGKRLDVTDEKGVDALVDSIVKNDGKIDVLCHAAGIIFAKPYMETTVEEL